MDWLSIKEFIKDTLKYVIFLIIILFIAVYVVGFQQIVGSSMKPTLNNEDIAILDKISYSFIDVKRNDIISLYYEDSKYLVKRVVGLPGEYVEYKDNKLYIDGKLMEEDYLNDITTTDFKLSDIGYQKIPKDMYLVLGDNREDSLDSRDSKVGLISKEDIIGKVRIRIWPINKFKFIK